MWKKKRITKLQEGPHCELLRSLIPFRHCDDGVLGVLATRSELLTAPVDYVLFERSSDETDVCFLVDGDIKLVDASGNSRIISGGSILSHVPLNPTLRCTEDAIVLDTATVMRLSREDIERVTGQPLEYAVNDLTGVQENQLEEGIYLDVYQALQSGRLELPSMPSTGVRIARHMEDPAADSDSLARIIQLDPALTARLIQVANSPAFKGRVEIESCRDAVTRLGQSTTRDMVISFVLKGLFRSRHPLIRQRMEQVWRHSTKVAAISYALARQVPVLDAGQAMLAGLMHDIGVIPILTSAERLPRLSDNPDSLDSVVSRVRGESGAMLLRKWGFAEEFVDAALHAEDWHYEGGKQTSYTDLVIIAQMHSYIGTPRMAEIPRIDKVPAFRKLSLGGLGPGMSLRVMDEAQEEINAMQHALD